VVKLTVRAERDLKAIFSYITKTGRRKRRKQPGGGISACERQSSASILALCVAQELLGGPNTGNCFYGGLPHVYRII
jgi:plasmid stabilization system protein ParE